MAKNLKVNTTILAGDSFADILLRVLITAVIDEAVVRWKPFKVYFAILVDDVQFLLPPNRPEQRP